MKKRLSLALSLSMLLALAACGSKPKQVELHIFAAASMTDTMDEIIENYKDVAPNVTIIPTYDSSGTLLTQIQEGAECDLFLSAAQKQMNTLEEDGALLEGTRLDLLENKVALAVPEGNPKGIESFDQLAELLNAGDVLLAMGNSDVPVGQYTQKIFAFYELDEEADKAAAEAFQVMYDRRDENFGNARDVRNVFEAAVARQANRVAAMEAPKMEDLMALTVTDLDLEENAE